MLFLRTSNVNIVCSIHVTIYRVAAIPASSKITKSSTRHTTRGFHNSELSGLKYNQRIAFTQNVSFAF